MARLFKKHPLTVFIAMKDTQGVLDLGIRAFDKLARLSFEDIDKTADASSVGFVTLENYRSTTFGPGNVEFGEYVVGSLRMDERKVPGPAIEKLHADMLDVEQERIKEQGREHISKDRRKELKEQATLRLRAKVPPTPKVMDWWWNQKTGLVFLTDKSATAVKLFTQYFNSAFGPEYTLWPVDLSNVLPRANEMETLVGTDFLTWLWGQTRRGTHSFNAGGQSLTAYVDSKITITNNNEKITATSKSDDAFDEIDAGIKAGKRVDSALIKIEYGENNEHWCTFELGANLFPILELSVPNAKILHGEDFGGTLTMQIGIIEEAFQRLRLLLVCYATMFKPEVISLGLQPQTIAEIREMPDTIYTYTEEGQVLISFRNAPVMTKIIPIGSEQAA